ncbi:hypothetical protein LA02_921 [Francisella philomiragia]|uniref:hypothetical protein n=2 Tax=Francisella philomiragia TaxID=28110 RepID=UPI0005A57C42|nr:hypothetical protein [Francisella philomiragia]AJI57628.1 hypothetical protein LA02_921 [Francisella philomiragia]
MKKIRRLLQSIFFTKQPSFIISARYLYNFSNMYIKTHRAIFFRSFKRIDLIIINLIAMLRWLSFYAWLTSYKVTKATSVQKLDEAGIKNKFSLYLRLVKLAIFNFIPPHYYFKYKLYKNDFIYFFYSKQNSLLHAYSDRYFEQSKKITKLISDKHAFLEFLDNNDLQTNYSYKVPLHKIFQDHGIIFKKQKVFCKPNVANRSTGALFIDYDISTEDYRLVTLVDKKEVYGKCDILDFVQRYYSCDEILLIEEFIEDDDDIKKLSQHPTDSTTMRIITATVGIDDFAPQVIYTQLEIPAFENNYRQQFYKILPLNIETLDIDLTNMPDFEDKQKLADMQLSANIKDKIYAAIDKCIKTHEMLTVRAIAFDVILSSQQSIIIEANYNWDIELLYRSYRPNQTQNTVAQEWLENL